MIAIIIVGIVYLISIVYVFLHRNKDAKSSSPLMTFFAILFVIMFAPVLACMLIMQDIKEAKQKKNDKENEKKKQEHQNFVKQEIQRIHNDNETIHWYGHEVAEVALMFKNTYRKVNRTGDLELLKDVANALIFPEDYLFDSIKHGRDDYHFSTTLYLRHKNSPSLGEYKYLPKKGGKSWETTEIIVPPLLDSIVVPFETKAIWQAYLLTLAYNYLPTSGDGLNFRFSIICSPHDLDIIENDYNVDCSQWKNHPILVPTINVNGDKCVIHYCIWSSYNGLSSVFVLGNKKGETIEFEDYNEREILVPYKSEIRFF